MEMKQSIIPWPEFLAAVRRQRPVQLQLWLRRWQFSDRGALLAERTGSFRFPMLRWLPKLTTGPRAISLEATSHGPAQDHR
jgi:hypothetical protein